MNFRASFCDPFQPDIIDLGSIPKDSIISKFENINWAEYLTKMKAVKESEIHYAPSLEIENRDTRNALSISAVGDPDKYEFYIFYKRPRKSKKLFGLIESIKENYISDKTGQARNDVLECLTALLRNDLDFLEAKFGK